ncbi:MAG: hypothetical protein HY539_01580 [Deltaproteobacteria bacterium]|nr:hypothetical protein [Deltaproteobacteria bacterium]
MTLKFTKFLLVAIILVTGCSAAIDNRMGEASGQVEEVTGEGKSLPEEETTIRVQGQVVLPSTGN